MVTTKTLRLDVTKKYTEPIYLVQYEVDARILDIYLSAGSLPINLTGASVVFYAKKPDGTILFNNCTVVDAVSGHVVYTVTGQMCAVAGDLRCWILVIKDDAELRSIEFKVTVQPSEDDTEAIESTSEFTALDEALAIVANIDALQQEIQALQQETQALKTGWIPLNGVATFNSIDNPTGVINVPSGHGIEVGNRLKLTNAGNTIYGIVTAVTSTTVTFLHELNSTTNLALNLLADSAITDVYISRHKTPSGFPANPRNWTITVSSASTQQVSSPSTSYQQAGSLQITVPIGAWKISMKGVSGVTLNTSGDVGCRFALSTSLTGVSDTDLHGFSYFAAMGTSGLRQHFPPFYIEAVKTVTSKTTFYVIMAGFVSAPANLGMRGDHSPTHIKAECAYL